MVLNINGFDWRIDLVPSHDPTLMVDGNVCCGTTWIGHARIFINNELAESRAIRTIRHELTHAYIWTTQAIRPESWDEEALCDFVAMYGGKIAQDADKVYAILYSNKRSVENE